MMEARRRGPAIIVLTVTSAIVPRLAFGFTISHRLFTMSKGTQEMFLMCIYQFFCTLHWSFFITCQLSGFAGLRDMSCHMTKCYVLRV